MIRGAQTQMASLYSAILLINTPPEEWRPEKASSLGGVIVVPGGVTPKDLETLKNRNLPYYIFSESDLPGPRVCLGQRRAARQQTERLLQQGHRRFALMTGFDAGLDATKRLGVNEALSEAGIDPGRVPELSAHGEEAGMLRAAKDLLSLRPRPTAVIAFDDSLGSMISFHARRNEGLRVPEDLSIVSFHDWPFLHYIEPTLTTARFEFFAAGQSAAEALSNAALTGQPVSDLNFEPTYRVGQTVGRAPADS